VTQFLERRVPSDSAEIKAGVVTVTPGAPMTITEIATIPTGATAVSREHAKKIGETIKAYLVAARDLLEGRYKTLRELAPLHMTSSCRPTAVIFPEGVLVRYDREDNPELTVVVATAVQLRRDDGTPLNLSLTDGAPLLSESFLHCAVDPNKYDPGDRAITVTLSARSAATGEGGEIAKQRIIAVVPLPLEGMILLSHSNRDRCH
jgi:hypothetical protein